MRQISIDRVIEMLLSLTDRQTDRQTEVSLSYLNPFFITDNEGTLSIKDRCFFVACFCLFENLKNDP